MRSQKSEVRSQKSELKNQKTEVRRQKLNFVKFVIVFLLFTIHYSLFTVVFATEKWPGVDKSVIEKIANEHGREVKGPLINTDHGDLLLFLFLISGAAAGFAAGYYWKTLLINRAKHTEHGVKTQ